MNRAELTFAVAAALVGAVLLGALLAWIAGRLNARGAAGLDQARDLAGRLQAAEAGWRQAAARGEDLAARLAETETELAAALDRLDRQRSQTEEIREAYRQAMRERKSG